MSAEAPEPGAVSLRPLDEVQVEALDNGVRLMDWHPDYPTPDDVTIARLWAEGRWDPPPWQIVDGGLVVGSIGSKGPAEDGGVEIAYGLIADVQGRGVGTTALTMALDELLARDVTRVLADTTPGNARSLRMLIRAGFTVVGENADEVLLSKRLVAEEPLD